MGKKSSMKILVCLLVLLVFTGCNVPDFSSRELVLNVNDFSEEKSNNVEEEEISVSGTAFSGEAAVETVSYSLKYAMDDEASVTGTASGTVSWRIEKLPLQIGTNVLTVTATDSKDRTVEKEIRFNRLSTQIRLSENVVLFEEEQNARIADDILDYRADDQGTEDTSDDLVNLLFREDAELVQQIKNNQIKIGDLIMLQPCEELYMGFNGTLVSYGDPEDGSRYPADEYEVLYFQPAGFTDIFDDDVSLSYEISDEENPVAFAYFPTDVEVASLDSDGLIQRILYASERNGEKSEEKKSGEQKSEEEKAGEQKIKEAGFQKDAISYMLKNAIKLNGDVTRSDDKGSGSDNDRISDINIELKFEDTVLYDRDGDGKTTNDQFKIGGSIALKNMQVEAGVEWHRTPLDPSPQQIIGKFSYNTEMGMHAEWTGSEDLRDLVKTANKALNHEFENNKQFSGITVSGIDMENSLILGMLGIQISPAGINPTIGVKNTQYESLFQGLNAIVVIIPVLDVTGNVTAKVGFTYQYSAYHEKGINMQKKGFVGSHGSLEENKGQVSVPLPYDRSLEIYDVYGRSASEKDVAPQWSVTFGGEGDAGEEVGLGANLGLMISGIVPVAAKASIYEKADVNGSGEIKLGNGLDAPENSGSRAQKNKVSVKADGDIGANMTVGLKAGVYFKLALKVKLPDKDHVEDEDNVEDKARLDSVGFTLGSSDPKEWKHDFCQITIAPITGSVTEEDYDTDDGNDQALEGVKVCLEKDPADDGTEEGEQDTEFPMEVYTDEDGNFRIPNIKDGEYRLTFSKDGYETYEKELTMSGEKQEIHVCLKKKGDFKAKLAELISEHGIFKESQSGTMHKWDDEWMNPTGILSATILDFDSDGEEEMLVCYTEPSSSDKKYYQIVMDMYEVTNGTVVLADSMPFSSANNMYGEGIQLTRSQGNSILLDLHVVKLNGKKCLLCENEEIATFSDGCFQDYWVVVYQNDKLQYRGSFTQTDGGDEMFEYTGYEFEDGKLINSQLYYNEGYPTFGNKPLYNDLSTSVAAFFSKMGISVITDIEMYRDVELGTILSENNDKSEIFRFINKETSSDYTSSTYKFTATLNRAENLGVQ